MTVASTVTPIQPAAGNPGTIHPDAVTSRAKFASLRKNPQARTGRPA
jgi:hypothetical protein